MEFFMPMIPPRTTAQQHRILKTGRVVPGEKVAAAKQKLIAHLYQHKPNTPFCALKVWDVYTEQTPD